MANEIVEATLAQMTSMGKKLRGLIRELSADVKTLKETGGQANVVERIKVNGRVLTPDGDKTVDVPVPTKVGELTNDAGYQANTLEHVQVNGAELPIADKTANVPVPTAVSQLTNDSGYQPNVLEGIKVNGLAQEIDSSKNVDISIPTKVSELTNDKTYQTKTEVENTVKTAVAGSKHTSFQKVSSVPAAADAKEDVMYLVMNSVTKHYDIYAKIADDAGNFKMELLDDTTVDLSGYVQKEAGKGLSHNDFTDTLLAKLNGIAEKANLYIHPSHTAYAEGLYKMTVNVLGHVTKATAVSKEDITVLGIPGQDTHDWASITGKPTSYPPSEHTHDDRYYTESELDTKLAGKSATGHKHLWADITNKPSTFAPSAHKHVKADITDFPTSLPASDVSAWAKAASKPSYGWSEITGKPSTFTPSSHTHGQYYDSGVSRSANTVLAAPDGKPGGATFRKLGLADIPNASDLINALTSGDASPVDNDFIVTQWANHEAADASNQNTYVRRPMSSIWGYIKSKADSVYQSKGNYAASSHTHTKSQIADFPTLGTAAAKNVGDFAAASHNHDTSYYKKSEIDTKLSGVAVSGHTHKKADITDFPTSMPASDVSAWAKAATKPSYAWSEITGKPSTFTPVSHTHDDRYYTESEMNSKLGAKAESVVLAANSDLNAVKTPGIYSCGGGNSIKNKPSGLDAIGLIVVHNASGEYYTQILTSSSDANTYRRTCLNDTWSTWTQDKYTDTNTWRGIQNNLTSDSTSDSLSAAQGKALKTLVDGKAPNGHTHTKSQVGLGNVDNTADANKSVKYATSAGSAAKATTADTANALSGFKPRSGQEWGVQTGTFVHGECDSTGGDFAFRRDCPAAGQVSMVIDGCFYQHEGQYRVLDESDKNQFATAGHTHDDRYYTESEMDAKLAKKADTHSHPYLPTAGGNMGGTAMIAWPDSGNFNNKNDGVTFPVKRGGLSWSGQSDGIQLFAEETGSDNLELILQFADDNSNGLTIRNKSGAAVSRLDANGGFSGSVAWEKITGKPSTFTPATHSHAWGDVTGKPSTFAPSAHKHVKADITDFPTSLPASDVKAWAKAANKPNYSWEEITNKPSTFTPAGHKHVKADITDFPTLGTAAAKNVGDFAAASHSHSWDSVTGKPTTFAPSSHNHDDRYYTESEIDTKLSGKANSSHTHNYAGSSSAGGTAASVNGFTFGVQTSDPGANSSLTTNKFLFVYE